VERDGPVLRLTVSDNGTGIREDAPLQNGLNNMRNRAESLGGDMSIKNNNGGGTILEWSVPHPGWAS
jgi:signal transduction histidine kinase